MRRLKHNTQNLTTFVLNKKAAEKQLKKSESQTKHPYFFLLFGVFILLYTIINAYIYIHGYRMLEVFGIGRWAYNIIFGFLAGAYILGEAIQDRKSSVFTDVLITIGGLWFVGIVHFFFISVLYDSLRLTNFFTGWISYPHMQAVAYHTTWISVVGTVATILLGYWNARTPIVKYFTFHLDKKNDTLKKLHEEGKNKTNRTGLRLVVASDIHLGATNGVNHIVRVVHKMNALKPDLILLPGDVVDGEIDPVIRRDIGSYLRRFEATFGVWGVTGNHEYIGGISEATKYLTDHGIRLLDDAWVEIGGIILIGRKDHSSKRFGTKRKQLEEIMRDVDKTKALILLDHQPRHLEVAEQNGIDVQFSGHTHNGQLWPLQYIVRHVFEIAAGYLKKGNTNIIVSSGIGTWGPPVRTNARPEILCVDLEFND